MSMRTFERIFKVAMDEARRVTCPAADFREALRGWREEIEMEIVASEESVDHEFGTDEFGRKTS